MTPNSAPPSARNLRIDGDRLWRSLMEMGEIGATPRGGCNRQALTDEDRRGRALFRTWCEQAGLAVRVDQVGSMFARMEGREDLPPLLIGSHLDTQPTGGKFDGVLGVLAGLEVVRSLREAGFTPRRPIEVVNWTNEEGCRFTPVMLGSAAFAGVASLQRVLDARDSKGARLGDELARMELDCAEPVGGRPVGAYLELHIEQGPVLEDEGCDIGFVTGGQGHLWYDARLEGFERHAGTTPMPARRDALAGAAFLVGETQRVGHAFAPHGVATVGQLDVRPNARNVIPGEVRMSVDIRHPDAASLAAMDARLHRAFETAKETFRLDGDIRRVSECQPLTFDETMLAAIRRATGELGLRGRDIVSGAGHDAFHMAKIAPAAMIFVPCKGGISHNESEDMTPEWARAGADVLLRAAIEIAETI